MEHIRYKKADISHLYVEVSALYRSLLQYHILLPVLSYLYHTALPPVNMFLLIQMFLSKPSYGAIRDSSFQSHFHSHPESALQHAVHNNNHR